MIQSVTAMTTKHIRHRRAVGRPSARRRRTRGVAARRTPEPIVPRRRPTPGPAVAQLRQDVGGAATAAASTPRSVAQVEPDTAR
jgi:hypothetical protein